MGEAGFFGFFIACGGIGAALLLGPIGQAIGRRIGGTSKDGLSTGEMTANRIDELESRVHELETAAGRVTDLEERLDFAERMLTQLPAGSAPDGGKEGRPDAR